jgi:hypothetical protein
MSSVMLVFALGGTIHEQSVENEPARTAHAMRADHSVQLLGSAQPCFCSKNCSSSVEPLSAAVDASRSIVVVTASK